MAMLRSLTQRRSDTGKTAAGDEAIRMRLGRLAWLLDDSIPLPGGYRIGIDGLIGLVPGIGDAAGALVAGYVVLQAGRLGASRALLLRMACNVLLETVVGAIPFAGDLFDFAFKANRRNLRLLERHVTDPAAQRTSNRAVAAGIVIGVLGVAALVLWGIAALLGALFGAVSP